MELFWGIVTGYLYCSQPDSPEYAIYRPYEPYPISLFWRQIASAIILVVATTILFYCTRKDVSVRRYVLGTAFGIAITIAAGLLLILALGEIGRPPSLPVTYPLGLGLYSFGFSVAIVLLTVNVTLLLTRGEVRFLRHLLLGFFAFLTFNWSVFVAALTLCS